MKKILILLCLCLGLSSVAFAEEVQPEIPAESTVSGERRMPGGFPGGEMPEGFAGRMPGGNRNLPEGMEQMTPPEGFENMTPPDFKELPADTQAESENSEETQTPAPENQEENRMPNGFPEEGGRPSFGEQDFSRQEAEPKGFWEKYGTSVLSGVLLAGAFFFVCFYRRKHY